MTQFLLVVDEEGASALNSVLGAGVVKYLPVHGSPSTDGLYNVLVTPLVKAEPPVTAEVKVEDV